jgi:glycosyltransferase involved in cell wall biosynthesis
MISTTPMNDRAGVRFIYYSHHTLQIPRVARQCMVALCEGAAELGATAEIVSYAVRVHPNEPIHPPFRELYGVTAPLRNTAISLPFGKSENEGLWARTGRLALYTRHFVRYVAGRERRRYRLTIVSARTYTVLTMLVGVRNLLRAPVVILADVHGMPSGARARRVHTMVDGNVCISQALADDLRKLLDLPSDRIRVAHTGVRPERFDLPGRTREDLRRELGLPLERRIVCYAGKVFYPYEEISYLIDAARDLNDGTTMLIVGGRPDHVRMWEEECARRGVGNVIFRDFAAPSIVPRYLMAADLLVSYYSPSPLNDYRSPGKLFEYMASGTPLLSGRSRSIEEVVRDGENGFLVEPYRPEMLAARINELLGEDGERLRSVAEAARTTIEQYTWRCRAKAFLDFGESIQGGKET